jgi:hypothetical protein
MVGPIMTFGMVEIQSVQPLVAAVFGFIVGAIYAAVITVWLVSFEKMHITTPWLTPAKKAGFRRSAKLIIFPVGGVIVTNAAGWATEYFTHAGLDPTTANAAGLILGAAVGGAHQTLTWGNPSVTPPASPPVTPAATPPAESTPPMP